MPEHDEAPVGSGGLIAERQVQRTCVHCHRPFMVPCAETPSTPEPINLPMTTENWTEVFAAAYRERRAILGSVSA